MASGPIIRVFSARRRGLVATTFVLSVVCMGLLPPPVFSQRYHTHTYTEGDGLSSSAVYDITQGSDGRMWFATRFGVSVYDGAHWTTYDLRDGLPNIDQRRILCDDQGRIWTVAPDYAVSVFQDGRWNTLPELDAVEFEFSPPAAVVPTDGGPVIVIATHSNGTHYFDGSSWVRVSLPGDPDQRIHDIILHNDRLLLAADSGVLVLDPADLQQPAVHAPMIPRRPTLGLASDAQSGTLWIAGSDHVARVRNGVYETLLDNVSFEMSDVNDYLACEPDRFGGLYIGNAIALYRYDADGLEKLGLGSGLPSRGATSLFRDRQGIMWAGTLRGVTRFYSLQFANYSREHGLQDNEVTAVVERDKNDFVLGHPAGFTFFGDTKTTIALPRRPESRVLDMALDKQGNVWAAVNPFGLARINTRNELEWIELDGEHDQFITSVRFDHSGLLWVTTISTTFTGTDGRFKIREQGVTPQEGSGYLRRIFETADSTIYIASNQGLYKILPDGYTHITASSSGRADQVYAVHLDASGTIWLGTMAGLCFVKNDEIIVAEDPRLRIDRPVYFIVEDEKRQLWFGTDNGLMCWNGSMMRVLTIADGLVGRETNRAAGMIDSRGRLWAGMDRGVSVYRPWFDIPGNVPPIARLTGIDINGDIYSADDRLELGARDNALVFRFDAMSYIDEKNVRFSAWLEGFDDQWLEGFFAPDREIRYTNLPPGEYRFHMRASSAEGAWSDPVSSAPISIDAPFWQKPQFLLLPILVLALIVAAAVTFISQRRYARRLENEVRARLDELRMVETELQKAQRIETLGTLAGGIAHDFNNLLTIIMGNLSFIAGNPQLEEDQQKRASDALSAAKKARSLTQQLLTFSRGGAPSRRPGHIADLIRDTASFTMSGASVSCNIDLPEDLMIVDIDADQISQVINNLLINSREAMPDGGTIHITARNHTSPPRPDLRPGRYVEVEITDDGPGIDPEQIDRVFDPYFSTKEGHTGMGLATSWSIVKRHDGLLAVESVPGACTTCRIFLPAAIDQSRPPTEAKSRPPSKPARILVMDDERAIRSLVGTALERAGHTVELAGNGAEAAAVYKQHLEQDRRFDLVIMDLTIQGGTGGKEALKLIRDEDPGVRAIVASGYSNDPVIADFKQHGFVGCIHKPFTEDDLLDAVARALVAPTDRD